MKGLMLILVVAGLVAGGCTHGEAFGDAKREIESQDLVIEKLSKRNEAMQRREGELTSRIQSLEAENRSLKSGQESLGRGMEDANRRLASFESQFGNLKDRFASMQPGGILVKPHQDGVALEVAETLLFQTGSATLSAEGAVLLRDLASRLQRRGESIRVEGHTDDRPVVVNAKRFPRGNLELSGERALVVAAFLVKEGGLSGDRVSFAGYGAHKPVVANDSDTNMARNRRVEIVLIGASESR